jgi:hypothetical protein
LEAKLLRKAHITSNWAGCLETGFEEIIAAGARFGAQTNNSRALPDGRGYCVLTIAASARASEKPRRTELRRQW